MHRGWWGAWDLVGPALEGVVWWSMLRLVTGQGADPAPSSPRSPEPVVPIHWLMSGWGEQLTVQGARSGVNMLAKPDIRG